MLIEIIGVVGYEVVTTALGLAGLKFMNGGLKKKLQGINRPKTLPLIDTYLKRQLGPLSKSEQWVSKKAVKAINRMTQYQSFRLLLILASRKVREREALSQNSNSTTRTRRLAPGHILAA